MSNSDTITADTTLSAEDARWRLVANGYDVQTQGMLWRVRQGDGEPTVLKRDELISLAEGFPPAPEQSAPAFGGRHFDGYAQSGNNALIPMGEIRTDGGTQARAQLDPATVDEYRDAYAAGAHLPPIVLFYDGATHWLADGFHRLAARDPATYPHVATPADVRQGTRRDAVLYAASANADHGLRRTTADKERAVLVLLQDEEWGQWSDREIARRCKVSHPFVAGIREKHGITGNISSARKTADGRTMNTTGIAAANAARGAINHPDGSPALASVAPSLPPDFADVAARFRALGWLLDASRTDDRYALYPPGDSPGIGNADWPGVLDRLAAIERHSLAIPPDIAAAAQNLALTIAARGDRLLLYWPDEADDLDQMDPLTFDLAREWLQTEAPGAAQNRAEALGWDQRVSSDGSRAWYRLTADGRETAAFADAALAAGEALRIAYGGATLTARLLTEQEADRAVIGTPTEAEQRRAELSPAAAAHRALVAAQNELQTRGWSVVRWGDGGYGMAIDGNHYAADADGVITAARLLSERSFATPDELMAAVNAIDAPADTPFWRSMSEHHPTAHYWTRTGQYSYRAACGMTAQRAPSGRTDAGQCSSCVRTLASTAATTAPAAPSCDCGQPSIAQRNIGGISGWRCALCASREEYDDLREQLGSQYQGWDDVGGIARHRIHWSDGSKGDYAYDDALSMLHSSAMQLRRQAAASKETPPDTPLDPRAAAVAWRSRMHTMLATCSPHAMFRLSEMQAAVAHLDAVLIDRRADALAVVAAIEMRVVEAETWLAHDLSAPHLPEALRQCRRQLDSLADDPGVDTETFDSLSARLGDCQAQLAESEQAV